MKKQKRSPKHKDSQTINLLHNRNYRNRRLLKRRLQESKQNTEVSAIQKVVHIKYAEHKENREFSIQMSNGKMKFIENKKNTYKPIQTLGL